MRGLHRLLGCTIYLTWNKDENCNFLYILSNFFVHTQNTCAIGWLSLNQREFKYQREAAAYI